jgi:hypothetical protein
LDFTVPALGLRALVRRILRGIHVSGIGVHSRGSVLLLFGDAGVGMRDQQPHFQRS